MSLYDEELAGLIPRRRRNDVGGGWGQRVFFCKLCLKLFLMTSSFFIFFRVGIEKKKRNVDQNDEFAA